MGQNIIRTNFQVAITEISATHHNPSPVQPKRLFIHASLPFARYLESTVILPIFVVMKKIGLHLLFWSVYLTEDTSLAYVWNGASSVNLSSTEKFLLSLKMCASLLPPKILFTYLVLYVILDRVLQQKTNYLIYITGLVIAVISTVLLIRCIEIYFIYPVVYNGARKAPPFISAFGFLFTLIDLGFVSGMAIAIRQLRLQFAGKEREKQLLKEKLEAELKFLKNQTNPHFLFNTLNNIYALARKKSDSTPDAVMKLSKILRFMLYESARKFIAIEEEIKLIDDYIDLERIRYNENLNVVFEKDIDNDDQEVSPLLLLPFVENAFKHGVSESFYDSMVKIKLRLKNGQLFFEIENSKEDEQAKQGPDSKIGLLNIKRQLELMYRDYTLDVDNQPSTFKVTLNVNLNNHGEI